MLKLLITKIIFMSDLASERESAEILIIGEHRRLVRLDPKNPLLTYITGVTDEGFEYSPDGNTRQRFLDIYAPEKGCYVAVMLARYFLALKEAADKIEGIEGTPESAGRQEPLTPPTLDLSDEELPF